MALQAAGLTDCQFYKDVQVINSHFQLVVEVLSYVLSEETVAVSN